MAGLAHLAAKSMKHALPMANVMAAGVCRGENMKWRIGLGGVMAKWRRKVAS